MPSMSPYHFSWTSCSCNAGCSNVFAGGPFDRSAALPTDGVVCSLRALSADEVSPERLLHDEQSAMVIPKAAHKTSRRSVQISPTGKMDADQDGPGFSKRGVSSADLCVGPFGVSKSSVQRLSQVVGHQRSVCEWTQAGADREVSRSGSHLRSIA